jgi:c-di-GMP-binding flagellar brake protein YcgR
MDQETSAPLATPGIEKRQHRRVKLITQLRCEASGREEVFVTRDISVGGMFVTTRNPFPQDEELAVSFRLHASAPLVSCRGKVMYALPGSGMGIMFLDLSEEHRQAVQKFVDEAN